MSLPFDGAISTFHKTGAPKALRDALDGAHKRDIIAASFPYRKRLDKRAYNTTMLALQIELSKLQAWVKRSGTRVAIVFEGRDASGKGGTIKRFRKNLNPRSARVVALSKPTDQEATQWYFQRYVQHLPAAGDIVMFDRSWYNRGVVEHVFGFCTPAQRALFFTQCPDFEQMLAEDDIKLVKLWLNVGRAEQLRRFVAREVDPLKQWKLSWIDVEGLTRWDAYTSAIAETFEHTDTQAAPWAVIRSDDKRRARIAALQQVLSQIDYEGKDPRVACTPDPLICGSTSLWHV
jgi:polyphosphate kinase 2